MLVIGNGESRRLINLNLIKSKKVGCNAIYRDYYVDYLVCVDKRMIKEALDSKVNENSLVYTRDDHFEQFKAKRLRVVPDLPYAGFERPDYPQHWGSGPYAVLLAATKSSNVKLIGFDLYGIDGKTNNMYKGTQNYNVNDKSAVDPSYWIYQIGKVFENYPKVEFTIYQEEDWVMPKQWKKRNVKVDFINNL